MITTKSQKEIRAAAKALEIDQYLEIRAGGHRQYADQAVEKWVVGEYGTCTVVTQALAAGRCPQAEGVIKKFFDALEDEDRELRASAREGLSASFKARGGRG